MVCPVSVRLDGWFWNRKKLAHRLSKVSPRLFPLLENGYVLRSPANGFRLFHA